MEIEINNESLSQDQRDVIQETIHGLNFIALNLEKNKLLQLSRLVRAVMVDFTSWSKNNFMFNDKSENGEHFREHLIDTSILAAMEFLAKFASLNDDEVKSDVIETIQKIEDMVSVNKKFN